VRAAHAKLLFGDEVRGLRYQQIDVDISRQQAFE